MDIDIHLSKNCIRQVANKSYFNIATSFPAFPLVLSSPLAFPYPTQTMTYHSPEQKHYDNSLVPPNSFYSTDGSSDMFARRAMSVMSSSSFQYTADDNHSIRSATLPPDNGVHLSKQDLAASLDAYENLLKAAQVYREQMQQLSGAAAGFGYALERVAKGKAVAEAGQGLQAAAGLQFLISNHQQIFVWLLESRWNDRLLLSNRFM